MEGRSELRIGRKDEEAQEQWPDLTRDPITPINRDGKYAMSSEGEDRRISSLVTVTVGPDGLMEYTTIIRITDMRGT